MSVMSQLRVLSKRQVFQPTEDYSSTTEELLVEEPETGVSLGQILGQNILIVQDVPK